MTMKAFGALRPAVAQVFGESVAESWRPTEALQLGGAATPTNQAFRQGNFSAQRKAFAVSALSALIGVLSCGVLRAQFPARRVVTTPLLPAVARTSAPAPTDVPAEATSGSAVGEAPVDFESVSPPAGQSQLPIKERASARERLRADKTRAALTTLPTLPEAMNPTPHAVANPAPSKEAPKEAPQVEAPKKPDAPHLDAQTVTVVMQVENGHVAQASVAASRPGMEAYEASALRIARQRRFPAGTIGKQTMLIKVTRQ